MISAETRPTVMSSSVAAGKFGPPLEEGRRESGLYDDRRVAHRHARDEEEQGQERRLPERVKLRAGEQHQAAEGRLVHRREQKAERDEPRHGLLQKRRDSQREAAQPPVAARAPLFEE